VSARNDWATVIAAGLVIFMAQLDTTIVNVALPALRSAFHATAATTQWIVISYPIPLVALTLLAGRWLDETNRGAALVGAAAAFASASALAAASPTLGWLIAARVLQGAAAAVLLALAPVLAVDAVDPSARGRALGVVATLAPLGGMCGPVIGGALVDRVGWSAIFLVNVPVAAVVVIVARRRSSSTTATRWPRVDWAVEAGVVGASCVAVLLGLSLPLALEQPAWLALCLIAVPCMTALGRLDSFRPVRRAIHHPEMRAAHVVFTASYTGLFVIQFIAPFFLVSSLQLSSTQLGLVLVALPAATAAAGPLSGALADRYGARRVAGPGAAISTAGILLLWPLAASWSAVAVAWRLAVVGVGFGLVVTPTQTFALNHAEPSLIATVSSTTNLARQVGILFGPALATVAWALSDYRLAGMRWALVVAAAASGTALAACRRLVPRNREATSTPSTQPAPGATAGTALRAPTP
jgi:MFS family permease